MEPGPLTWVGSPCGLHGPYKFYRAFRFHRDDRRRLLSVGDFFLVRCEPGQPLCIAELQLLWEERTQQQLLSSSKLYFLPEDTPQGRSARHGEDEVIAVSEKVIVRLEDLVKWTVWEPEAWSRGMKALPLKLGAENADSLLRYHDSTLSCGLNFKDVFKKKAALGEGLSQKQVLVLSYPRYCRYRSVVARLHEQPTSLLTNRVVLALGGITALSENTHILYCRDTFDHPTILQNERVCDEFAPNLKGRPRKKKPSNSLCSEDKDHYQKSLKETENTDKKANAQLSAEKSRGNNSQITTLELSEERRRRGRDVEYRAEEQAFLVSLYKYMKERKTPIERIPYLGFKQINLWTLFQAAQNLGGYDLITARRQWKHIYDELGGNPGSTSAATCTRRHYERLLLPYERFIRGEEDNPLPQVTPRIQTGEDSSTESSSSACIPILKTKACPEKTDTQKTKEQDCSRAELMAHNPQLKPEPQICITRVDPPQAHRIRKRRSPAQDCQSGSELQLKLYREDEVKRWCCDPSYLPASPMTNHNQSTHRLASPKISNHSAVDLWQHQQVPLKDQCHAGKLRNLQSPTVPDPPSEQADLPKTEDIFLGFRTFCKSSGVSGTIMSPLAKKKAQVSSTGLPNQSQFPFNYGQPPPLLTSSLSNRITEEAAEQPVVAAESSAVGLSRPSVIQHAQSFKPRVQKDTVRKINERAPSPLYSHEYHLHHSPTSHSHSEKPQCSSTPSLTPKLLASRQIPQRFNNNLYSSSSSLCCWYKKAETAGETVIAESVHDGSKQSQEQGEPNISSRFLQSAVSHQSEYSTRTDQDKSCNRSMTEADDQPTDLSLPKSSLNPLPGSYTPSSRRCSIGYQESTPAFSLKEQTAVNIAHHSPAHRVPLQTCISYSRPAGTAVNGTISNGGVVKKRAVGDVGGQERFRAPKGSQDVPDHICAAQTLSELGNSLPQRMVAATHTPKDIIPSSSTSREFKTSKELYAAFVGDGTEGTKVGAAASPFSVRNPTTPQIYPAAFHTARTLALSRVPDRCKDTFGIPFTMDQSQFLKHHLQNPLQYLKTPSMDFFFPLVPPLTIESSLIQRQYVAQAAGCPTHIYQQTYGDLIHRRLYSVSVNPETTFSQPQLKSVHPGTSLSLYTEQRGCDS